MLNNKDTQLRPSTLLRKTERLPVGAAATCVGAATLSNLYKNIGFVWIRHITMGISAVVLAAAIIKILIYFKTFKKEYAGTVTASLYAAVPMLGMSLSNYIFDFNQRVGKIIWITSVVIHILHILLFTWNHVLKGVDRETFVPSWFVTYNGFLVSAVTGVVMGEEKLCRMIVVYGIIVYSVLLPLMLFRLIKKPVHSSVMHTKAVVLSPCSLCLTGYLSYFEEPNRFIVYLLYLAVIISVIYIIYNMPAFFSVKFHPGYAGLTFPMAIGVTASGMMSGYLIKNGMQTMGFYALQIQGIQLYLTTSIIAYIGFRLLVNCVKEFTHN